MPWMKVDCYFLWEHRVNSFEGPRQQVHGKKEARYIAWQRGRISGEFDCDDRVAERLDRKPKLAGESDVLVAESH